MNAIQEKCRPKHQVLILRCYPRTTKGAVDVKPNSSELSYLLFYATSRRSKIQKIGAFLEKKTASDVWRMRIGNVQVTLGILAALVEKSPKDAVLIAPVMLKILDLVLRSGDITMIESSLPTFEAFCEHHDQSSLFADPAYFQHYQSVVRAYAELASTRPLDTKVIDAKPIQNRRRSAGLRAIRSIVASDALGSPSGRQVEIIMPVILQNLWVSDDALEILLQRVKGEEKEDAMGAMRRRTSISTVKTTDTADDSANPVSFSGTAMDADKLAEEEINMAALHCLRDIYVVPNRPQVHSATNALIKFAFERASEGHAVLEQSRESGWAIKLFSIIARWAPVQDRFVIIVSAMDNMTKIPIKEENMDQHLTLAAMVGSLLRSDINLIGLSVMDVLLALIKQMRRLFNLPLNDSLSGSVDEKAPPETDSETPKRKDLLTQLEGCVGDLATHVYYADQIPDMIQAILGRLKPTRSSSTTSTPQVEKTDENGHSSSGDLNESNSQVDTYFSYNMGRVSALQVVKRILLVANPKTKVTGNVDLSRNKVPAHVWEGSHWLLRDPDGLVRKAYVEALITWLDRETSRLDLKAQDEMLVKARSSSQKTSPPREPNTARRAVSNSSANRERPTNGRRSQFLPMLHLSIYDNALQFVDYDSDMVLLHVLLTNLVFKLGVNATRFGIPMVYRLQEDIQDLEIPIHKVRIASLCHGYFWALTEKFDFEASVVGRAIQNEVARRRQKGFWVEGISIPAPTMQQVATPGQPSSAPAWTDEELEREEILPFDDRTSLVECIAIAYEEVSKAPPLSPPTSPGRPILNPMLSSTASAVSGKDAETDLPSRFRDQMLTNFSRDEVVAALQSETKAESLTGSRTATTITTRQRLVLHTGAHGSNGFLPASPYGSQRNMRPHSSQVAADPDRLGAFSKVRKTSVRSAVAQSHSMSGKVIASVEQLKLVLAGNAPAARFAAMEEDDSDDSMVSYEDSPSEVSFNPPQHTETGGSMVSRRSSQPGADGLTGEEADSVPPVPPLPRMHSHSFRKTDSVGDVSVQDYATSPTSTKPYKRGIHSRGGDSMRSSLRSRGLVGENGASMDLQELLRGIDSRGGEGSLGNLTKPPY